MRKTRDVFLLALIGLAFLASPAAGMITGCVLPVDGGFLAQ